jgi:hypothetical protein
VPKRPSRVKIAPEPSPAVPNPVDVTAVPTTRYDPVRVRPPAPGAVTRTVEPMEAPTWRRVVLPNMTSSLVVGLRPPFVVTSNPPRMLWPANASTVRPSMVTSPLTPAVMPVRARARSRDVSIWAACS